MAAYLALKFHILYHQVTYMGRGAMNERKKIENLIKKKELETISLEEQVKGAKVYIQALQDVLKMLPKPSESIVLRPGSEVARAREIILSKGQPVHIAALLEALEKEPTRENRASLTSSLAAYVRRRQVFTRPAPNTFGLIELGHVNTEDMPEPPPEFGGNVELESPKPSILEDEEIPW
jgi:hypothetical protein